MHRCICIIQNSSSRLIWVYAQQRSCIALHQHVYTLNRRLLLMLRRQSRTLNTLCVHSGTADAQTGRSSSSVSNPNIMYNTSISLSGDDAIPIASLAPGAVVQLPLVLLPMEAGTQQLPKLVLKDQQDNKVYDILPGASVFVRTQ